MPRIQYAIRYGDTSVAGDGFVMAEGSSILPQVGMDYSAVTLN